MALFGTGTDELLGRSHNEFENVSYHKRRRLKPMRQTLSDRNLIRLVCTVPAKRLLFRGSISSGMEGPLESEELESYPPRCQVATQNYVQSLAEKAAISALADAADSNASVLVLFKAFIEIEMTSCDGFSRRISCSNVSRDLGAIQKRSLLLVVGHVQDSLVHIP